MDKLTYSDDDDDSSDRLTINVGGVKFETYITTLQNIPDTRLAWLTENIDIELLHTKDFFFDRHPGAFVHIMNFYRTGKLHTPTDICGPAFEEELQFWGIDEKQMEPCCWESFTKHREAEENLRNFEGPGFEDLRVIDRKISTFSTSYQQNACVRFCDFEKVWQILEDPHSSTLAKRFSLLSCLMIIISVSAYCLSTLPVIQDSIYLKMIDYACLIFFTLEIIIRIISTPDRIAFFKNYKNWVDIFSVLPSYMNLIFITENWVRNLVIIRILRVFRFFKLSYGLQVLVHSLKASSYELTLLLLILLIPVVIFSSLVYAVEKAFNVNSKFDSVPRTFWWCIITMTTVGYGDLVPVTWPGQVIGSICSICGLLIVALPISVIGSNFSLYYAHVRARLKLPKKNRTLLQGNLRGLLRQPLSLSSRDRDRKSLRRNQNNAIRRKTPDILSPNSSRKYLLRKKAFDEISNNSSHSACVDVCAVETPMYDNYASFYQTSDYMKTTNKGRRQAAIVVDMSDSDWLAEKTDISETASLIKEISPKTKHKKVLTTSEIYKKIPTSSEVDNKMSTSSEIDNKIPTSSEIDSIVEEDIGNKQSIDHSQLQDDLSTQNPNGPTILVDDNDIIVDKQDETSLSNPHLNLINVVFSETLRKHMPDEMKLSQTLFSPIPLKNPKVFTKETGTPRVSRRGALALLSHQSSTSDNNSDIEATTRDLSNSVSLTRTHLDVPENTLSIRSNSNNSPAEPTRRTSMRMMTSFEDLQIGATTSDDSKNISDEMKSTSDDTKDQQERKKLKHKQNNNNYSSVQIDTKLKRSQSERKPTKSKRKPKRNLLHGTSETDLRSCISPNKENTSNSVKESGV